VNHEYISTVQFATPIQHISYKVAVIDTDIQTVMHPHKTNYKRNNYMNMN